MSESNYHKFRWTGVKEPNLSRIKLDSCEQIIIGRYGGNLEAGAFKNEDGVLVWKGENWELSMILDGHTSSESVELVINTLENEWDQLVKILEMPVKDVFQSIEKHLLSIFQSSDFKKSCENVQGETACLICLRKENYLWWFSVGDCLAYVFHDEFHRMGQYALNQRQFYEWIGFVNTFSLPVPCYSSGIRELRTGNSVILMVTDGILECGDRYYENPKHLYEELISQTDHSILETRVRNILEYVHNCKGKDSATMVCWEYNNTLPAQYPSDLPNRGEKNV